MTVTGLKPPPDSNCWAARRATRSRLAACCRSAWRSLASVTWYADAARCSFTWAWS